MPDTGLCRACSEIDLQCKSVKYTCRCMKYAAYAAREIFSSKILW